jgi:putative oxidoreductase
MKAIYLIGRVAFGAFFVYNGVNHLLSHEQLTPYAGAKGVPNPQLAVLGSGAALVLGGASLMLGLKPKLGAISVAGFLAIASATMHDFWNSDPATKQNDMIHFMKNMALLSAALAVGTSERAEWVS